MSYIVSTAEQQRGTDVVQCVLAKDAHVLHFVLVATDERGARINPSSYTCAVFSTLQERDCQSYQPSHRFSSEPISSDTPSSRSSEKTIANSLWMQATATTTTTPVPSAATASQASPFACPCCAHSSSYNAKGREDDTQRLPPMTRPVWPSSTRTASYAALRATEYFSTRKVSAACLSEPAAHTHSTSHSKGSACSTRAAAGERPFDLARLHIVREHGEGALVDVWCSFTCGCSALATFSINCATAQAKAAHLVGCVWVPMHSWVGLQLSATASNIRDVPVLTDAATTSVLRPWRDASSGEESARAMEMLLLTVYSTRSSPAPLLHFTRLRSVSGGAGDARGTPPASCRATTVKWRLDAQGWFDTHEIFRIPPALRSMESVACEAGSATAVADEEAPLRHPVRGAESCGAALRNVRWLPGTLDAAHNLPLLALLYCAPAVAMGDPSLDKLSVCYLKEEPTEASRKLAATNVAAASPCKALRGRLLLGPWSVRGVTLAHPSFLLATTLASTPRNSSPAAAQNARESEEEGRKVPGTRVALEAFRNARRAVMGSPTPLLGVFQRPASQPFAASKLLRGARRRASEAAAGDADAQRVPWDAKGNEQAFAFVLYGAAGEAARFVLDGYPECASSVATGGMPQGEQDRRNTEGRHKVLRVCALLAGAASVPDQDGTSGDCTAVVLTVLAQPAGGARGAAGVSDGGVGSSSSTVASSVVRTCTQRWKGSDAAWRFSIQMTQRVAMSYACLSCAPSSLATAAQSLRLSTLITLDQILCWTSTAEERRTGQASCVQVLLSGVAAVTEGSVDTLHAGLFVGSTSQSQYAVKVANDVLSDAAAVGDAVASPPPHCIPGKARGHNTDNFVQRWSAVDFARWSLFCGSLDTTSRDVISHAAPAVLVHPALPTRFPSNLLPVALAWVTQRPLARDVTPLADAQASSAQQLAEVDVVALLRSGDVVGWRCAACESDESLWTEEQPVLRLGTVRYSDGQELTEMFLSLLFGEGRGPGDMHMDVVFADRGRPACAATVLLVIAVGPLAGVINLCNGTVEHVLDVRRAQISTTDAETDGVSQNAQHSLYVAAYATQFQRLPASTPYAVAVCLGKEEGIGETFSFLWTGLLSYDNRRGTSGALGTDVAGAGCETKAVNTDGTEPRKRCERVLSCVIHLSIVCWADVAGSQSCLESLDGATLRQWQRASAMTPHVEESGPSAAEIRSSLMRPSPLPANAASPPPIISLRLGTEWLGQEVVVPNEALSQWRESHTAQTRSSRLLHCDALCPFVGCIDTGWAEREATLSPKANSSLPSVENATTAPCRGNATSAAVPLCVCDAFLLSSLWPGTRTQFEELATSQCISAAQPYRRGTSCSNGISSGAGHERQPLRWLCWTSPGMQKASAADNEGCNAAAEAVVRRLLLRPHSACAMQLNGAAPVRVASLRLPALTLDMTWASAIQTAAGVKQSPSAVDASPRMNVLFATSLMWSAASSPPLLSSSRVRHSGVLCTVSLEDNNVPHRSSLSSSATRRSTRVASYILCGVHSATTRRPSPEAAPPQAPATSLESDLSDIRFTWHWLPLPKLSLRQTEREGLPDVPVGVTRALPIASAGTTASSENAHGDGGQKEYYCEGVAEDARAGSGASFMAGRLVVQWDRLYAVLKRCLCPSQAGAESVFVYDLVDPALLCWKSVSLSGVS